MASRAKKKANKPIASQLTVYNETLYHKGIPFAIYYTKPSHEKLPIGISLLDIEYTIENHTFDETLIKAQQTIDTYLQPLDEIRNDICSIFNTTPQQTPMNTIEEISTLVKPLEILLTKINHMLNKDPIIEEGELNEEHTSNN